MAETGKVVWMKVDKDVDPQFLDVRFELGKDGGETKRGGKYVVQTYQSEELPLAKGLSLRLVRPMVTLGKSSDAPAEKAGTGTSCPSCKTLNPGDAAFCKSCGEKLKDPWRCACGKWLDGGSFCNACGTKRENVPDPKANVQEESGNDDESGHLSFDLGGEDEVKSLTDVAEEWFSELREADKPSGPKGKNTLRVKNGPTTLETRLLRNLPQELRYALHKGDTEVLPLILEGLTLSGFPKSEKLRSMLTDDDLTTLFKEAFPL